MLISSISEIKSVLPVGAGNDFLRLRPHLQNAETAYLVPLLGKNMYEELDEFYQEPPQGELTAVQQATQTLLAKVQYTIVHLAYFTAFDFLNVSISDMGFNRMESERSKSLFKYQEDNLKDYFKSAGYNALDDILVFLEQNIEYFGEYKSTENWTVFRQLFISTARDFNEIVFINNSRLTFLWLRPHMAFVENSHILPLLGPEIFSFVKSQMTQDTPEPKVTAILLLIRQAIAFLSSALLMEESGADLTDRGLYFTSTMQNLTENHKVAPSDPERIALLVARNRQTGMNFLASLKTYLAAHPEDWPQAAVVTETWLRRDNTGKKTFWA